MSAHRVLRDLFRAFEAVGPGILNDPGASGTITPTMWGQQCLITTATGETRTLARPTRAGILTSVVLDTDVGDCTLTVTGGYNQDAATSIVLADAGDMVVFLSVKTGTTYQWTLISEEGTTAAGGVLTEVVTTTNVITAAESGTRFILNTATAFVSTLPAPAAGLEFWFYIGATAPTTSHTVVTNASANIIEGSIGTPETPTTAVTVAAAADTITFVANKAVHGDFAHVWSDGTTWYLNGMCFVQDGMTTTQAS